VTVPLYPLSDDELARAVELYESGVAPSAIAQRLSKSSAIRGTQQVRSALEGTGIVVPGNARAGRPGLAPEKIEKILQLHDEGKFLVSIAKAVGSSPETTRKYLLLNGREPKKRPPGPPKQPRSSMGPGQTDKEYEADMLVLTHSSCAKPFCSWQWEGTTGEVAEAFRSHPCPT